MKKYLFIIIAGIIVFTPFLTSYAQQTEDEARVVITEYSDFQCPACGYFYPMIEKLKQEYGADLEVQYRYFPLNSHQFAALAARAAEAARNQGEFDRMHDLLFENQQSWSSSGNPQGVFIEYAREMGLDVEQFRNELNSAEIQQAVMEQKKEGQQRGVNSTPTFFINGDKLEPLPRNYQDFQGIVDRYMQEAG